MNYFEQRKRLVDYMKIREIIKTKALENAFLSVPREEFLPEHLKPEAYADTALPIGYGQTISQPSTIAIMFELLQAGKDMRVLEIGAGTGYTACLLSRIVGNKGKVYSIDVVEDLCASARQNSSRLAEKDSAYKNIEVLCMDGSKGLSGKAPFDRILVNAACSDFPRKLIEQLADPGVLVAPIGPRYLQYLYKVRKVKGGVLKERFLEYPFVFVPFV